MDRNQPFHRTKPSAQASGGERCPRCGTIAPLVYVHGHAQCSACGSNILDCCQGSDCDLAARR